MSDEQQNGQKITVLEGGPYRVSGGIPVRTTDYVYSEHGEPMTWKADAPVDTEDPCLLCRCGQSENRPFCDGSHTDHDWDPSESAPTDTFADRARPKHGEGLTVMDDAKLCMHAGQCGHRESNIWKMLRNADDSIVRAQIVRMVENCPSGRLVNIIDEAEVEPSLPTEIGVVPGGPLWVTGGVPVERSDGEPFETRNRVTLCRCGASDKKPLCDGSHKKIAFEGIT